VTIEIDWCPQKSWRGCLNSEVCPRVCTLTHPPVREEWLEVRTRDGHPAVLETIGATGNIYGSAPGEFTRTYWFADGRHNYARNFDLDPQDVQAFVIRTEKIQQRNRGQRI